MTDHPIFFNSDMIRAILDGRKTQTRRIVTVPWHKGRRCLPYEPHWVVEDGKLLRADEYGDFHEKAGPCGVAGDLLWVRETWRVNSVGYYCREHRANHDIHIEFATLPGDARGGSINICGDEEMLVTARAYYYKHIDGDYSPSIHMPKWACRNWLKVKSNRVERVQEISQDDAIAEGVLKDDWCGCSTGCHLCMPYHTAEDCWETEAFGMLWDSIYAAPKPCYAKKVITHYVSYPWEGIRETREHRGKPWHVFGNPHVFVTEFERHAK